MPNFQVDDLHWYALRAPANKEHATAQILTRRGYLCLVPSETKFRRANRYAKRKREITLPIFPRYCFVGFPTNPPPWYDIFSLPLVQGVVSVTTDGEPSQMKLSAIQHLVRVYGQQPLRAPRPEQFMHTKREFKEGDEARIVEGAYADRTVKVDRIRGHMAEIMLPLFGADMPVKVPLALLEAA